MRRGRSRRWSKGIVDQEATCTPTSTLFSSPLLHGGRSPARAARERSSKGHRRGGRHAVCGAADHGHPVRSAFPRRGREAGFSSVPELPQQPGYHKPRARLVSTIEWLIGMFAADSAGFTDDIVLLDSTPAECGRSLETVRRSELADWAGYGSSRSHSRFFWGMRLRLAVAPDGTPRAWALVGADRPEREAPGRSPTSTPGSPVACSHSQPASPSTTSSDARAARSWPTSPERVESTS